MALFQIDFYTFGQNVTLMFHLLEIDSIILASILIIIKAKQLYTIAIPQDTSYKFSKILLPIRINIILQIERILYIIFGLNLKIGHNNKSNTLIIIIKNPIIFVIRFRL